MLANACRDERPRVPEPTKFGSTSVAGHASHYIEGNSCSYRWHAARRARADTRIQYVNANAVADQRWYESKLQRVLDEDADAMGLPRHLGHDQYNEAVRREMVKRVKPRYEALITAIKAKKHARREKAPEMRAVLEALSIETYERILSKTAARRERGLDATLNDIAPVLYR